MVEEDAGIALLERGEGGGEQDVVAEGLEVVGC